MKQKDSFTRNFSHVFVAKLFIVGFTFLTTPLLTRIYSPEAYGYFSFFNTLATNFATISTLGFPTALIIANNERDFYNLFISLIGISILFLFVFAIVFVFSCNLIIPFDISGNKRWYILQILVGSLIFSWMLIFPKVNTRRSQFKTGSAINVLVNGSARITSLGIGFFKNGYSLGLIAGDLLGKCLGLLVNIYIFIKQEWREMWRQISRSEMKDVLKKYIKYPKYILTGTYLGLLSTHIPLMVFPFIFDANIFGNYSLAAGLIALPGILVAQPLSSVFIKKVTILKDANDSQIAPIVNRLAYGLFVFGLLPFSVIAVFGPELFSWVLGDNWITAGKFAAILAIYGLFELTQGSIQTVLQVFQLQKYIFQYNLLQLIMVILFMLPGIRLQNAYAVTWGVTIAKTVSCLFVLYHVLKASKINPYSAILRFLLFFAIAFGSLMIMKEIF